MLYLKTLLLAFVLPSVLLGYYLWRKKALPIKSILVATLIFAIFAIPIDIYMTSQGVWTFGFEHTIGIWFFGMPLEEYLFYFTLLISIKKIHKMFIFDVVF